MKHRVLNSGSFDFIIYHKSFIFESVLINHPVFFWDLTHSFPLIFILVLFCRLAAGEQRMFAVINQSPRTVIKKNDTGAAARVSVYMQKMTFKADAIGTHRSEISPLPVPPLAAQQTHKSPCAVS